MRLLMNTLCIGVLTSEDPTETSVHQSHRFLDVGCSSQNDIFLGGKTVVEVVGRVLPKTMVPGPVIS